MSIEILDGKLLRSLCQAADVDYRPQRIGLLFELFREYAPFLVRVGSVGSPANSGHPLLECFNRHGYHLSFEQPHSQNEFLALLNDVVTAPFKDLVCSMGYSHWLQTRHVNMPTLFLSKTYQHKQEFPHVDPCESTIRDIALSMKAMPALYCHISSAATLSDAWRRCMHQLDPNRVGVIEPLVSVGKVA